MGANPLSRSIYGICVSNLGSEFYGLPSRHSHSSAVRHAVFDCCLHQVPELVSRGESAARAEYISPAVYSPHSGQGDLLRGKPEHVVGKYCTVAEKDNKVAGVHESDDVGFAVMPKDSSCDHREYSALPALLAHSNHHTLGTSR